MIKLEFKSWIFQTNLKNKIEFNIHDKHSFLWCKESIQIKDLISLSSIIRKVYVSEQKRINLSHYQEELILSASWMWNYTRLSIKCSCVRVFLAYILLLAGEVYIDLSFSMLSVPFHSGWNTRNASYQSKNRSKTE